MPIVRHGYAVRRTTSQRGYPTRHRTLRRKLEPIVAQGNTPCARCGNLIAAGEPWDLDHTPDRTSYLGPSHAVCNRGNRGRGTPTGDIEQGRPTHLPARKTS